MTYLWINFRQLDKEKTLIPSRAFSLSVSTKQSCFRLFLILMVFRCQTFFSILESILWKKWWSQKDKTICDTYLDNLNLVKHNKYWRFNSRLEPIFVTTPGVNVINILRTNFLYANHFGSFFYIQVTREKLPKHYSHKKFELLTLMKLTVALS